MVVFIFCIILIVLIIAITIIFFSQIKLELINFTIRDYENLLMIFKNIKDKQYANIFDHTDFILKLKVCILKRITIFKFKVSDDGIEKFLRRQIRKNKLKKEEREVKKYYEKERGTSSPYNSYGDPPGYFPAEWSKETDVGLKHNGIALIYPSDYVYATNGGSIGREICFNKTFSDWSNTVNECYKNDWLKVKENLFTLFVDLDMSSNVYMIGETASIGVGSDSTAYIELVWPTAYLTKNVTITSGEGTMEQPYELQLNA